MELMRKICTFVRVVWARPSISFSFQLKLGTVLLKSRMDPDFWKRPSYYRKTSSKLAVSPIFSQFCPFLAKNCLKMDFFGGNFVFCMTWVYLIGTQLFWPILLGFRSFLLKKKENLGHFCPIFDIYFEP